MDYLFCLASFSLALVLLASADLLRGNRSIRALRNSSPLVTCGLPRVSIVVAARNEQRNIREALQSLLNLEYPDYELLVVDDRSEDGTGEILDRMASQNVRLKVIHVDILPPGWLGKNHALWVGSQRASGELLLFTDADIVMEGTVLTRAVHFMEQNRLDHLAATPSMKMPTTLLGMFGTAFIVYFSLFARPWKACDPKSRCHIGIGAFNLINAGIYRQVGGHETIRLRPDDDVKLGKIIKLSSFRQEAAYAPDFLVVEWYATVGEVIGGLEKNAFSGADYNVLLVLFGVAIHSLCSIWPFVATFTTSGAVQLLYLAISALILLVVADCARFHRSCPWHALGYPFMTILFMYILVRTMLFNIILGGIRWRGTFYSLKELKANRI